MCFTRVDHRPTAPARCAGTAVLNLHAGRRADAAASGALGRADDGSGRSLPPPRCPAENCKRHTILKQEFHIRKFT